MRLQFPALGGLDPLNGIAAPGLVTPWSNGLADTLTPKRPDSAPVAEVGPERVVIVGGGFAGMTTAASLAGPASAGRFGVHNPCERPEYPLFTPMLAEVAGGSLEPSHISAPLRTALRRTEFVRGRAEGVDFGRRILTVAPAKGGPGSAREIPFTTPVPAVGSVSNYFGAANIQKNAFDFKTLLDAIRIRNHVIEMFERADREADPEVRRSLVTFVIAGGGFAGVELAGALNDFSRGILADYPRVPAGEVRTVLVYFARPHPAGAERVAGL